VSVIRKALNVEAPPILSKESKTAKAIQNMGIHHGICICGSKILIIKTIANKFRNSSRAPPKIKDIITLNYSICDN